MPRKGHRLEAVAPGGLLFQSLGVKDSPCRMCRYIEPHGQESWLCALEAGLDLAAELIRNSIECFDVLGKTPQGDEGAPSSCSTGC